MSWNEYQTLWLAYHADSDQKVNEALEALEDYAKIFRSFDANQLNNSVIELMDIRNAWNVALSNAESFETFERIEDLLKVVNHAITATFLKLQELETGNL